MVHEFFETKLNFPKENFETNNFWILEIFLKIHSEYYPLIVQNCNFPKAFWGQQMIFYFLYTSLMHFLSALRTEVHTTWTERNVKVLNQEVKSSWATIYHAMQKNP